MFKSVNFAISQSVTIFYQWRNRFWRIKINSEKKTQSLWKIDIIWKKKVKNEYISKYYTNYKKKTFYLLLIIKNKYVHYHLWQHIHLSYNMIITEITILFKYDNKCFKKSINMSTWPPFWQVHIFIIQRIYPPFFIIFFFRIVLFIEFFVFIV